VRLTFRHPALSAALALSVPALLPASGLAGDGGATPGGVIAYGSSGVSLSARSGTLVDRRLAFHGAAPSSARGHRISVQRRAGARWRTVARATVARDGAYAARYTPTAHGTFRYRAVLGRSAGAPQVAVTVYKAERATYYGPGLYGNSTACGQTLAPDTIGVAHRTLPCGTRVRVMYHGRSLVVPVIDRGPFGAGANWDLTEAAAKQIGLEGTAVIGVLRAR
jgi:rare lipoprotein A (peptidoglycan hydrolase)